jgi:hypothetical protein
MITMCAADESVIIYMIQVDTGDIRRLTPTASVLQGLNKNESKNCHWNALMLPREHE